MVKRPANGTHRGNHGPSEAQCTCALVRRSARRITRIYDAALRETGLRITQYSILANLDRVDSISVTDLAKLLVTDRTTLTRNLRPLRRDGLVQLSEGPDNRSKALTLTPRGKQVLETARPLWRGAEKSIRKRLGEDDRQRLSDLLDRALPAAQDW